MSGVIGVKGRVNYDEASNITLLMRVNLTSDHRHRLPILGRMARSETTPTISAFVLHDTE